MNTKRILEIVRIDCDAESALYALLEEVKDIGNRSTARLQLKYQELVNAVKEYDNE